MPEYYVSILNWPVEGENPEDAARNAYRSLQSDPTGFFLTVTENPGTFGDLPNEEFDSFNFGETANV